ncbi:MAG: type IX secretion system membrane protein PorP/SprF [Bacteroidales bacterium]|nr:type IX secretion system membrane protein PorP/SprF [Bacteroidales bacterium]
MVINRKKLTLLLSLLLLSIGLSAQFDAQFDQYWYDHTVENPAAVGERQMMQVSLLQRNQWIGVKHAPITTLLAANVPFKMRKHNGAHGMGIQFKSDVLGIFANQYMAAEYAYKFQVGKNMLSFGANIGAVNVICYGDSVKLVESEYHTANDPAIPTGKKSGIGFDVGVGTWYSGENWYVGLSATHLPKIKIHLGETSVFNILPMMMASGGYDFKLHSPYYIIKTSALVLTDFKTWDFHATALLSFKEKYWGGLTGRRNGLGLIFGTNFFKGLTLGYTYELPLGNRMLRFTSGSHELYVGYEFDILGGKGDKSYKSVRYL